MGTWQIVAGMFLGGTPHTRASGAARPTPAPVRALCERAPSIMVLACTDLEIVLALALLRRRAAAARRADALGAEHAELVYLRERTRRAAPSAPAAAALSLPPEADALKRWLYQQQGEPAAVVQSGIALMETLCLASGRRTALDHENSCAALSMVLSRVLQAENLCGTCSEMPSVRFAQWLCNAVLHCPPEIATAARYRTRRPPAPLPPQGVLEPGY